MDHTTASSNECDRKFPVEICIENTLQKGPFRETKSTSCLPLRIYLGYPQAPTAYVQEKKIITNIGGSIFLSPNRLDVLECHHYVYKLVQLFQSL